MIYEYRTSLTASAGSTSAVTLKITGGLMQQFLVQANTASTVFRSNLVDKKSTTRMQYGFHTGQLNDVGSSLPLQGEITINITNASPNDIFKVTLAVDESRA
jgi:hypothetical protein